MRIGNNSLDSLLGTGAVNGAGAESPSVTNSPAGARADSVSLSNASSLIGLAKATTSATQPAKLASLTAQLRAGQYQTNTAQVSQALVEGHLQV